LIEFVLIRVDVPNKNNKPKNVPNKNIPYKCMEK
jgi:hypothetical protein